VDFTLVCRGRSRFRVRPGWFRRLWREIRPRSSHPLCCPPSYFNRTRSHLARNARSRCRPLQTPWSLVVSSGTSRYVLARSVRAIRPRDCYMRSEPSRESNWVLPVSHPCLLGVHERSPVSVHGLQAANCGSSAPQSNFLFAVIRNRAYEPRICGARLPPCVPMGLDSVELI
jgi:hypothetical protein